MRPNKILAIGDIHIFNHKRFDEHRHVFKNLYTLIDQEKPEVIVIGGDVIDSKLRLSPEQVQLCRDFLQELAARAPIVMIPGNHDTNLANKERLDSLTPIVYSLLDDTNHPIFYFKHSGLYNAVNMRWAVWSCIDDQRNPFEPNYNKNEFVIGLYHGVVSGATTDDNFKLSGGVEVSEFDNCDMVILADIHKQQSFRNGEINYTGSLIQVNVTESPNGSCLIYTDNGKNYDVEVKRIQNDYSTLTLIADEKFLPSTILPTQKVRMKFDTEKMTRSQAMESAKNLKSIFKVPIIIAPIVKKKDKSVIKVDDRTNEINSNNVIDYFKDFVEKAKDRLDIKDIAIDLPKLLKFEKDFSKGEVKDFEFGDYSVYKVVMNNFLSFGPQDTIIEDFSNDGLLGIVGENRVGKSSIIKAIQFCLFYEMPNNVSAFKMINKYNRTKPAVVEVCFTKAGKSYKVKRTLSPNKKGTGVEVTLYFGEIDANGKEINNLTKESRPYTETEIRKYLGINETFEMLSVFSAQKRQTEFIDCKNAERLKLVNKFLGLQNFELKEENVLAALKEKNAVYNNLMKQFDNESNLSTMQASLKKNEVLLKISVNDEKEIRSEQEELEDMYREIITMYNFNLKNAQRKIDEPVMIKRKIDDLNAEKKEYEGLININIESSKRIKEEADELAEEFKTEFKAEFNSWKSDYTDINDLKGKIAVLDHEIKKAQEQSTMTECASCGKNFTPDDKEKVLVRLEGMRGERKTLQDVVKKKEDAISDAKFYVSKIKEVYKKSSDLISVENNRLLSGIKDITIEIANLQLAMNEYDNVQEAKEVILMLKPKVDEYNSEKKELSDKLSDIQYKIGVYQSAIKELNKGIDERKKKAKLLENIEDEIRLLKAYRKIVNKDGLPLYILQSKIDEINEKVNLVVSQVFDFKLDFSIDDAKGELKIQYNYDEPEGNDIGLASGSETFVINVCIKVGLSQISNLPKIDSFFIDEGYDSLDAKAIEKLPALFEMLTNYYKNVVTISHMDIIKDMCTHQIKLEMKNKYTAIV